MRAALEWRSKVSEHGVSCGFVVGAGHVIERRQPRQGLHIHIMGLRRERVDKEDQDVQPAFGDGAARPWASSEHAAIKQKLAELGTGAKVLGFNYDTGERYLSVPDFLWALLLILLFGVLLPVFHISVTSVSPGSTVDAKRVLMLFT